MYSYFFGFIWGLVILAALIGWGRLWFALFKQQILATPFAQAAYGLAISVIIGGVLNLARDVSKASDLVYLAAGVLSFLVLYGRDLLLGKLHFQFPKIKGVGGFVAVAIVAMVLLRFSLSISFFPFHPYDDLQGYLAFPAKMIQTGSLGLNPFSERGAISSLGGKYFLDTFVLSVLDFKNLHLMEDGIAFVILIGLLWDFLKAQGVLRDFGLPVLLLAALVTYPSTDITSFYSAMCLFLLFFRLLFYSQNNVSQKSDAVLVALISASLCALKTNFIAPCGILFLAYFFLQYQKSESRRALKQFCLSLVLAAIFIFPWMLAMRQNLGTFLYPILGKGLALWGYDGMASPLRFFNFYGLERLFSEFVSGLATFLPALVLAVFTLRFLPKEKYLAMWLIFAACLVGIAALIYGIGGYSLYYYSLPFLMPAILTGIGALLAKSGSESGTPAFDKKIILAFAVLLFSLGVYFQKDLDFVLSLKSAAALGGGNLNNLVTSNLAGPVEKQKYVDLQLSVPPGQIILSRLDRNFYYNFRRNPVYIIDMPGAVALKPGLPSFKGPEAVAAYLLSQHIRFVAYSYANQANFTYAAVGTMLAPHVNPWLRDETRYALDFQDNLFKLGRTRKRIYDDGGNFVLDLSEKIN
jgi:hypothetical protein